jgi:hypothetical protein
MSAVLGIDYVSEQEQPCWPDVMRACANSGRGVWGSHKISDPKYQTGWRSCMILHATAATRMLMISRIIRRLRNSIKFLYRVLKVI